MVLKVRNGGCIPFFITERKCSEAALVQVVQEAYVQDVSTRKIEKLAKSLGIESISRSQVSEMTRGLNEQAEAFRNRPLTAASYSCPMSGCNVWESTNARRVISMAILLVYGVTNDGKREVLAIEPMLEESKKATNNCLRNLKERGSTKTWLDSTNLSPFELLLFSW